MIIEMIMMIMIKKKKIGGNYRGRRGRERGREEETAEGRGK